MCIIFVFTKTDSIILIKALYEMACWLIKNRDSQIIFYVSESIDTSLFKESKINVRWLNGVITADEIPEADIVISNNLSLLEELSNFNRGELFYLDEQNRNIHNDVITRFSLAELGIGIPKRFFLTEEPRGKRVLIGGDQLTNKELRKILLAIEKAAPSFYAEDILVINSSIDNNIDTALDYSFVSGDKLDFSEVLKNSFYLIWVGKNNYPIIPLWAMASGVIVIGVNFSDLEFEYPIEISDLESMELALELMKTYKIGQYRNRILVSSKEIARQGKMEIVGEKYHSFLEKSLKKSVQNTEGSQSIIQNSVENKKEEYLLDIIIVKNNSFKYLENCITDLKKNTSFSYRIFIVGNDIKNSKITDLKNQEDIIIVGGKEDLTYAAACNKAILAGTGEFIVLLNTADKLIGDCLKPLVEAAKEDDVAVAGSRLLDSEERIIDGGIVELKESFRPRSWRDEKEGFKFDKQKDVIGFRDTTCLIKRDLLPILGLLDEGYLSSFEILDYSLRAREKGYRNVYCPNSVVQLHQKDGLENSELCFKQTKSNSYNISKKRFYSKWSDLINGGEKRREPCKIIVAGLVSWDYKMLRSQQLVRNLAKLGYEILYINPVCNREGYKQVEDNITVYTPSGYGTVLYNLQIGRHIAIGAEIANLVSKMNFNNSIIILNAPYWLPILKNIEYSVLVYDCIDNYGVLDNLSYNMDFLKEHEEQILFLSDLILTSSNSLYQEMKKINENTYRLENGFDKDMYSLSYQPLITAEDIPVDSKIVGYYGPISDCLDIELIESAAKKYKGVKFLMIGEVNTDIHNLLNLDNVIFTGEKPYNILADYIYYFDLAIIPLKINEQTELVDPISLYECIAAGKRVLTTRIPEVEKFKGIVEIVDSPVKFIDKMGQLLSEEDIQEDKLRRWNKISSHSWYNRAEELSQIIHLAYYDLYLNLDENDKSNIDISNEKEKSTYLDMKENEFLKTSSIEKFTEDSNLSEEGIEVEVKESISLIKKIKNFFKGI